MNDSTRKRKLLTISGLILLVLTIVIVGITSIIERNKKADPSYTVKTVNKDTGEVLYSTPNRTPEKGSQKSSELIIFGSYLIRENGATQAQFSKVKDLLGEYSQKNLRNRYDSLTIIPEGFNANSGRLEGQMRLGDTSKLVQLTIDVTKLTYVQVVIKDTTGQNGSSYDSGQKVIDADFYGPGGDVTF